jgi:hypothetical protein
VLAGAAFAGSEAPVAPDQLPLDSLSSSPSEFCSGLTYVPTAAHWPSLAQATDDGMTFGSTSASVGGAGVGAADQLPPLLVTSRPC